MIRPSRTTRVILLLVGIIAVFVGWVSWQFETEYGGNANLAMEVNGDTAIVYEVPEGTPDGHLTGAPAFIGSVEEAATYADQRDRRSYVVPTAIIAAGGLLVAAGVLLPRRSKRRPDATPGRV